MESVDCAWNCRMCCYTLLCCWRQCRNVPVCFLYSADMRKFWSGGTGEQYYKITRFFSGISMEIYLSYMVIFRVIEKIGINEMFGNGWLQYAVTFVFVLAGSTVFSVVMQKIFGWIGKKVSVRSSSQID